MSQHSHLTFLSHGESRLGASNTSVEISMYNFLPFFSSYHFTIVNRVDNRTPQEKLIDVVEYLQQLKTNKQVISLKIFKRIFDIFLLGYHDGHN